MAVSFAALTADEIAGFANDKPLFGEQPTNLGPLAAALGVSVRWRTSGVWDATDDTDAGYPTCRAYDGFGDLDTRPNAAAATNYLLFDFGTFGGGISFDFISFLGHNLSTHKATFEVADNNAYSTNLRAVSTFAAISGNGRQADWAPHHTGSAALRYSGVRYARIKFEAATGTITPQINEVWWGTRLQMPANPDVGWAPYSFAGRQESANTLSGVRMRAMRYMGQRVLNASWRKDDANLAYGFASFVAWSYGSFIWLPRPAAAPTQWLSMYQDDDDLIVDPVLEENPGVYRMSLSAKEQGPQEYFLAVGAH